MGAVTDLVQEIIMTMTMTMIIGNDLGRRQPSDLGLDQVPEIKKKEIKMVALEMVLEMVLGMALQIRMMIRWWNDADRWNNRTYFSRFSIFLTFFFSFFAKKIFFLSQFHVSK